MEREKEKLLHETWNFLKNFRAVRMVCFCCGFRFVNFGRIAMTLARSLSLSPTRSLSLSLTWGWGTSVGGRQVAKSGKSVASCQSNKRLLYWSHASNTRTKTKIIYWSVFQKDIKGFTEYIAHGVYSIQSLSANFVLISLPHSNLSFVHSIHPKIQINFPSHTFSN